MTPERPGRPNADSQLPAGRVGFYSMPMGTCPGTWHSKGTDLSQGDWRARQDSNL